MLRDQLINLGGEEFYEQMWQDEFKSAERSYGVNYFIFDDEQLVIQSFCADASCVWVQTDDVQLMEDAQRWWASAMFASYESWHSAQREAELRR